MTQRSAYADIPYFARMVADSLDVGVLEQLPLPLQRTLRRLRVELLRAQQASASPSTELLALADMVEGARGHAGYITVQVADGAYRDALVEALRYPRAPIDGAVELVADRDEADRRAGAAERDLQHARDRLHAIDQVRTQMKRDAGYHPNVSFDLVWAEVLTKARRWDALKETECDRSRET